MERIEFEPEELSVAGQWHGGQSSMLYAIASTGALSRGTQRPRVACDACGDRGWNPEVPTERCRACRGARMTDRQWLAHLASKLECEAEDCAERAFESGLGDDADALNGIAEKCREAIAALGGAS